jgi:hypothetical protein
VSTDLNDGDIMRGAGTIRQFLRALLSDPSISDKKVWDWIYRGKIPGGKVGGDVVASKQALRRHYAKAAGLSPN